MRVRVALFSWVVAVAFAPGAAVAHGDEVRLTIEAGEHDRTNAPVSVRLPWARPWVPTHATLTDESGNEIRSQVAAPSIGSRALGAAPVKGGAGDKADPSITLNFVVPFLAAGKQSTYKALFTPNPAPAAGDGFVWERSDKLDTLYFASEVANAATRQRVLQYMHEALNDSSPARRMETFKVFHHVFSPDGERLLTQWSPKQLFPHHRGLFYGFNIVTYDGNEQADVWHCKGDAHQLHRRTVSSAAGEILGRHVVEIAWNGNGKKTFATEQRETTVYCLPGGTLIDFVSRLAPTDGKITLDGDPQHAGLHFRASHEVAESTKGQTYYLRTDGAGKPGETLNWDPKSPSSPESKASVNRPWNAMSFVVEGNRYTALIMDHPDNPKPARYSERDYGRFGSYFVAEATPETPLVVRYRLWVQDGEMSREKAAAMAADFVDPMGVKVVAK